MAQQPFLGAPVADELKFTLESYAAKKKLLSDMIKALNSERDSR